jgi:hypothetical protein
MTSVQLAADRALARIVPAAGPLSTECWHWPGAKSRQGYAYIRVGRKIETVHRLLYTVLVGRVPRGRELHHRCYDPGCVNPHHLEPLRKAVHGLEHRLLVCGRGHDLTGSGRNARGQCRQCRLERKRRRYRRLRNQGFSVAEAISRA